MTLEERHEMLLKEKLEFKKIGNFKMSKDEEIKSLKTLLECIKWSDNLSDEEIDKIYKEELKKIEEKYK